MMIIVIVMTIIIIMFSSSSSSSYYDQLRVAGRALELREVALLVELVAGADHRGLLRPITTTSEND